jgi:hypothetical protein
MSAFRGRHIITLCLLLHIAIIPSPTGHRSADWSASRSTKTPISVRSWSSVPRFMRPRTASTVTRLGSLRPVCDWSSPTPYALPFGSLALIRGHTRASNERIPCLSARYDQDERSWSPLGASSAPVTGPSSASGRWATAVQRLLRGYEVGACRDGTTPLVQQSRKHPPNARSQPRRYLAPSYGWPGEVSLVLPRLRAGIESGSGAVRVRPSTGSFTKKKQHRTGSGVTYRGAQQVLPGRPTNCSGAPGKKSSCARPR